jgi:hypothetical protein
MPYGILKADTLTYYTATGDVNLAISGIALQGAALVSGVSGIFTTVVSGATVTGNAGQFTTITGGTANFANITGVSGTFTTRISGATVTGNTAQFTTATAVTGVFTTSVSGATVTGDLGLFNTLSGNQVVLATGLSIPSGSASSPSISVNGDPNTGLYSPGADQVAISTSGTGRLFVDASGNVGVGKNPTYALDVAGTIQITNNAYYRALNSTGGSVRLLGLGADNNIYFGQESTGFTAFYANGSERMRLDSSGRLGLGTSSPGVSLDVVAGSDAIAYRVRGRSSDSIGAIQFTDNGAATQYASIQTPAANTLALLTASTERLRIDSSGRVGIGSTAPLTTLECRGQFSISNNAGSYWVLDRDDSDGRLKLLDSSTSTNERLAVDSSGRLLVGTSTHSGLNVTSYTGLNAYFANTGDTGISLSRFQNTTNGPSVQLLKSRGTSVGSLTTVSSGDSLGEVVFAGADGDEFRAGASIEAIVDGTPGNNDMPGRLVFSTTADGASSPTERVRISQNGVVTVKNGAVAEIGTLTDGATVTPDFAANCNFTLTISGNRTLANPTNITAGQTGSIFIIQGSGSNTLSWGSYWDFAGGTAPTLSTASGAIDRVDYVVRTSTSIHTVFTANYS